MRGDRLYLRNNVQIEPLFDNWYAWSHLIPPATAARNMTERHFRIMNSYISAPQVHANAVKDPKMLGGPFIDYGGERTGEIAGLLNRTKQKRASLVALSNAISELDAMLAVHAKGLSLQPLYPKVPPLLRGYVELVYDLNNHPSFRLIESLLYRSGYYQRDAQSILMSVTKDDDRPFVLSTPRLDTDDSLHLNIPFDDERLDWIFSLKRNAEAWEEIAARIDVPREKQTFFRGLFTEDPPSPYQSYDGPGIRWRYFGHACILIEAFNVTLLFDPVLSYTYESDVSRYTYQDLPDRIDFVVITHNHQDHLLFETMLQIRHKVGTVVVPSSRGGALQDPSLQLLLEKIGFSNVVELRELKSLEFENGSIMGIPFLGEHCDLDVQTKLGYLVKIGTRSLLLLADSCNIEPILYEHLRNYIGEIDVLFIGMECDGAPLSWLYGPLITTKIDRAADSSRRLSGSDYEQAIKIVDQFNPKQAYVYAMGQEPWLNYIMSIKYTEESRPIVESNRFIKECHARAIDAERLFGEKEIFVFQ